MLLTCPCCHSRYSVDATLQDEAARDLLAMRGSLPPRIWNPLIAYLGLFRSESRALAWDKALKLAKDIQAMGLETGEWGRLENALCDTVESLRQRPGKPLKNHNYLKRVLENTTSAIVPAMRETSPAPRSKAAQAAAALQQWGGQSWLHMEIANSLCGMLAMNLKHTPAAEVVTANAEIWHTLLKRHLTIEEVDPPRLWKALEALLPKLTEWPQPKQLIELLPPRPQRDAIQHQASDADREAGRRLRREYLESHGGKHETPA